MVGQADPTVRLEAVLRTGHRLPRLEHELPLPGADRRARGQDPRSATALHERFFGPLGLDATWYQAAEKPRARTAHGYRFAGTSRTAPAIDLSDGTGIVPFTSVVAGETAGSIATTSNDAATWARLLYSGRVLGPEMTAEMLRGVGLTAAYKPRIPYGLGVQAFPIDGRPTIGHSGTLLGFRAAMRYLPGEATTISVLTNQSRADPGAIVQGLLSVVFAPEPPCFRCQDASASGRRGRRHLEIALRRGTTDARSRDHRLRTGWDPRPIADAFARRMLTGPRHTGMPIRVEAYTAGGVATGVVARSGPLRDALDGAGDLLVERAHWLPLDGSGEQPAGRPPPPHRRPAPARRARRPRISRSTPSGTTSGSTSVRTA